MDQACHLRLAAQQCGKACLTGRLDSVFLEAMPRIQGAASQLVSLPERRSLSALERGKAAHRSPNRYPVATACSSSFFRR